MYTITTRTTGAPINADPITVMTSTYGPYHKEEFAANNSGQFCYCMDCTLSAYWEKPKL